MKKNTFIVHFQILFRLCLLERQNEDNLWILSNRKAAISYYI